MAFLFSALVAIYTSVDTRNYSAVKRGRLTGRETLQVKGPYVMTNFEELESGTWNSYPPDACGQKTHFTFEGISVMHYQGEGACDGDNDDQFGNYVYNATTKRLTLLDKALIELLLMQPRALRAWNEMRTP